jgi:DNA-directed RNA polymerase specialized sigma24 family protein
MAEWEDSVKCTTIRDILERSLDELPDELRAVFVACVVDGITPEQCAELFALT